MILHAVTGKRIHFDKKTSKQHIFAHVKESLRKQGKLSRVGGYGSACMYRHPDGVSKCAVGCLIDDKEYRTGVREGCTLDGQPETLKVFKLNFEVVEMCRRLQEIHDGSFTYEELLHKLDTFVP